jgi:hypothetical protein
MHFRASLLAWALVCQTSWAADKPPLVSPEDCILDTLKAANKDVGAMVRFNCIRKYLRDAQAQAVEVDLDGIKNARAAWQATIQAIPTPIPESLRITLKNDTTFTVISAKIVVRRKRDKVAETYFGYVEYPIEPYTVGTIYLSVNTGVPDFFKEYDWGFETVYGLP